MVQHNNLVNFLAWEAAAFAHSPADVFLQKTPTNFDVSVEELWTPLVTGAPLVVAKPNGHKDTGYLLELINRHGVTNLSMVPSQVRVCVWGGGFRAEPVGWKEVSCSQSGPGSRGVSLGGVRRSVYEVHTHRSMPSSQAVLFPGSFQQQKRCDCTPQAPTTLIQSVTRVRPLSRICG
jgi:hypothetical protein